MKNSLQVDQAGQLVTCTLYDLDDTEPITVFTEKEATKLLEYMVWDGSHEDDYITEAQVEGKRQRATWKNDISTPDLQKDPALSEAKLKAAVAAWRKKGFRLHDPAQALMYRAFEEPDEQRRVRLAKDALDDEKNE